MLNTGRRRYGHPALNGSLPTPWLPSIEKPRKFGDGAKERRGVVLSLRRKMGRKGKGQGAIRLQDDDAAENANEWASGSAPTDGSRAPEGWFTGTWDESNRAESSAVSQQNGMYAEPYTVEDTDAPARDGGWPGGIEARQGDHDTDMARSRMSTASSASGSSTMNPWASIDKGGSRKSNGPDRKVASNGAGMKISLPLQDNVWGEDSSEGEEENDGEVSPVSFILIDRTRGQHGVVVHCRLPQVRDDNLESPKLARLMTQSTYYHHPERRLTGSSTGKSPVNAIGRPEDGILGVGKRLAP